MNFLSGKGDLTFTRIKDNVRSAIFGSVSKQSIPDNELQPKTPPTPSRTTRSAASRSRQMSPDSNPVKCKTKSVPRVLEGTFGDGIVIPDDDPSSADTPLNVHRKSRPTRSYNSTPYAKRPPRNTVIDLDEFESSPEERRLLGEEEQPPPDAVLIDIPSRNLEVHMAKPKKPFGLRPVNSLDQTNQPPLSGRQDFYQRKTHLGDGSLIREKVASPSKQSVDRSESRRVDQSQSRPHKRRRLSISSTSNNRDAMDSIEKSIPQREKSNSRQHLSAMYGYQPTEKVSGVRDTALRRLASQGTNKTVQDTRIPRRSLSPDELFMKEAREERKSAAQDKSSDINLDEYSELSTNSLRRRQRSQDSDTSATWKPRPRPKSFSRTPEMSRMSARLLQGDQSPDILQIGFDPNQKQRTVRSKVTGGKNEKSSVKHAYQLRSFLSQTHGRLEDCTLEIEEKMKKFFIYPGPSTQLDTTTAVYSLKIGLIRRLNIPEPGADFEKNKILILDLLLDNVLKDHRCYLDFKEQNESVEFYNSILMLEDNIEQAWRSAKFLARVMAMAWSTTTDFLTGKQTEECPSINNRESIQERNITQTNGRRENCTRTIDQSDLPHSRPVTSQISEGVRNTAKQDSSSTKDILISDVDAAIETQQPRVRKDRRLRSRSPTPAKQSETTGQRQRRGPIWKVPLVYPFKGKRKETVSWEDLNRLDDKEYLNDSLVSLFLRYLQEQADHDALKRMHFFNTFFFEKLTTPAAGKSKNSINYEGVASWTRLFDLFSRDFVIVPVNQHLHWYAMIICNLKWFKEDIEGAPDVEESDDLVQQQEKNTSAGGISRGDTPSAEPNTNDNQEGLEDAASNIPAPVSKRRSSSRSISRRKWDTTKPIIITLDSLDIARSGTASILKDYIVEEAKQKRNWDISKDDIAGMTAKNIPYQKNLSDCGLYMCMYIEQFMRDPEAFVHSILQRDIAKIKWPNSIASRVLRQRMLDTMEDLHSVQVEHNKVSEVPPVGRILIRDEDFKHGMNKSQTTPIGTTTEIIDGLDFYDSLSVLEGEDVNSERQLSEYTDEFIVSRDQTKQGRVSSHLNVSQHVGDLEDITSRHFPQVLEDDGESEMPPKVPESNHDATPNLQSFEGMQTDSINHGNVREGTRKMNGDEKMRTILVRRSPQHTRSASQESVSTDYLTSDRSYNGDTGAAGNHHEPDHHSIDSFQGFGDDDDDIQITREQPARSRYNTSLQRQEASRKGTDSREHRTASVTTGIDGDQDMLMTS